MVDISTDVESDPGIKLIIRITLVSFSWKVGSVETVELRYNRRMKKSRGVSRLP